MHKIFFKIYCENVLFGFHNKYIGSLFPILYNYYLVWKKMFENRTVLSFDRLTSIFYKHPKNFVRFQSSLFVILIHWNDVLLKLDVFPMNQFIHPLCSFLHEKQDLLCDSCSRLRLSSTRQLIQL